MERHELFWELDAFDTHWKQKYHNLEAAVLAAEKETPYIMDLYLDYTDQHPRAVDGVPDVKGHFEECQKLDAESALPFRLDDIGRAHPGAGQ